MYAVIINRGGVMQKVALLNSLAVPAFAFIEYRNSYTFARLPHNSIVLN